MNHARSRIRCSTPLLALVVAACIDEPTATPEANEPSSAPAVAEPDTGQWHDGGSSFSTGTNAAGERYELSSESRYQLAGDRLIFERTYIGDDDASVDAVMAELTPDGLELVEGELTWEIAVAAGETKVVTTTLKAIREGVVRLRAGDRYGSRTYAWVVEDAVLRECQGRECELPVATNEPLSGRRITIELVNDCSELEEFVVYATTDDARAPDSLPVHSIEPGERRTMEIDAAQWILRHDPDRPHGGGVHTDSDGGRVRFSMEGDECSVISAEDGPPPRADHGP